MKPGRFLWPLAAAIALGGAWALAEHYPNPIYIRDFDIRGIFGPELKYLRFLATIPIIVLVVRVVDALLFDVFVARRRRERAPTLLRQIISIALYVILFVWVLGVIIGRPITGFLLGGTVAAAVLGLALQDTLGNLFAGISIHVERTYQVGDLIRSGDLIGVVEWASWRATKIRTFNNNVVVVPNALLARERLEVFARDNLNARLVPVLVGYEFPPARVISVLERAVRNLEWISSEIPAIARVAGFAENGLQYEVKYWSRHIHLRDTIDAEIRKAIWYAFRRAGIVIPLPVRQLTRHNRVAVEVIPPERIPPRLSGAVVFKPLSPEETERLIQTIHAETFGKGETIIRGGEPGTSMYIIDEGTVSVRKAEGAGSTEIARLGPGEFFGEMALLTGDPRKATVVALSDVIALEIDKEHLQPILQENPALVQSISRIMFERQTRAVTANADMDETHPRLLARIVSWFGVHAE